MSGQDFSDDNVLFGDAVAPPSDEAPVARVQKRYQ